MVFLDRRIVVFGSLFSAMQASAFAADLSYKTWSFAPGGGIRDLPDATIQSLKDQANIVDSLPIKPQILAFFHAVPLEVDPTTSGGAGAYSFDKHKMFLSLQPDPPANPVFLHELLHAYHDQRLPGGRGNRTILGFYGEASKSGGFPDRSYMMKNHVEFFAMCTSVVLWGKAARPPYTRSNVQDHLPDFYTWIVEEFYPPGTGPS